MSKVVYLDEFAWTFQQTATPPGARSGAQAHRNIEDDIEIIRRFPSFGAFVDQLIRDLGAGSDAQQRAADLAALEEERLLLRRHAGR